MYLLIFCGIAVFAVILALLIKKFKMYDLIAGYNTMPKEEKKNYDVTSLANNLGLMLYFMAVLSALFGFVLYFGNFSNHTNTFIIIAYSIILMIMPIILVKNKNNKN
ncbi:hypothetical protein CSA08_04805 [Candidatus Gracilibacteria bacterium]|nr:MAG: hypothetical protein CSA08_04805 [Candidatus Gracilibacteria bacterium]